VIQPGLGDDLWTVTAASRTLQLLSLGMFAGVFVLFVELERPGLGIAHGFYLAIILAGLAAGPVQGALAGVSATVLYALGVYLSSRVPTASLPTLSTGIRAITFISVGVVVGLYASRSRRLAAELERIAEEQRTLASRDRLTGLPNTRAFEVAVDERLQARGEFALLVGDLDGLKRVNEANGYDEGNDTLQRFAATVRATVAPTADVARIGDDEIAVLAEIVAADHPAELAMQLQTALELQGISATFGWASYPREADTALGLYRIADERLYARKVLLGGAFTS
jgi:diguanylate cyclase (GGDEF)-like protein